MNFYKMNDFQNIKITQFTFTLILLLLGFGSAKASMHSKDTLSSNSFHFIYLEDDCDLCGCTTSGGSASFGDLSLSNFIGLRYIYQNFESRDGIFNNSPKSKEQFNTYQIWGRVPLSESFFLSAIIPYQDLTRDFNNRTEHINGLGDINIMGWYQFKLYKKKQETAGEMDFVVERERSNHTLNFGLGLKLPTGEFEERLSDKINPGFQVGTGSLDVFSTLVYGYKKSNVGFVTTLAYYLKTENKNDYRFGNQFSYAAATFYDLNFEKSILKPMLGISGDVYGSIEQFGEELAETNGSIFNGSIGSEFVSGKFLFGVKYTLPIDQNLFGGNVESKNNLSFYLNYAL
ncbi:hypothetical protein [Aequorivita sp. Q41]|uniref:hypothetical protein n=1 Tax=Aequorivita sp. Q41 TaxID=3153300 RepID=UPI00324235F2